MAGDLYNDLINSDMYKSLPCFLDRLEFLITNEITIGSERRDLTDYLIDKDFLKEIQDLSESGISLHFGKTLRDIKCVISDDYLGDHVIWIQYVGPKDLCLREVDLPQSYIQDLLKPYKSIHEAVNMFKKHLVGLSNYLCELSRIDECCIVMEPIRRTFKENYRKVQLADKLWLHVEVSPDGSPKNRSFIGQFDQQKSQEFLQAWDHNKDIASNILTIISSLDGGCDTYQEVTIPECAICYCTELPGDKNVPQPLCNNSNCTAYFHKSCLYEWLVACARGRLPQFGVGKCPSCSQYTCAVQEYSPQ